MSFEHEDFFKRRAQAQEKIRETEIKLNLRKKPEPKEQEKPSLSELLGQEETAGAVRMVLEMVGEKDLGEKLLKTEGEDLNENDTRRLLECREVVLEVISEAERMTQFLQRKNSLEDLVNFSPGLAEIKGLLGEEKMKNLFDKNFFIELFIKDKMRAEELMERLDFFDRAPQWFAEIKKEIESIAKKFKIPAPGIEEIMAITDDTERKRKFRMLISKHRGTFQKIINQYQFFTGGPSPQERASADLDKVESKKIYENIDLLSSYISDAKNTFGETLAGLRENSEASSKSRLRKRITNLASGRELEEGIEQDMEFSEAREIAKDKKAVNRIVTEKWAPYIISKFRAANPNQKNVDIYDWFESILNDQQRKDYKKEFFEKFGPAIRKETFKNKKGFWCRIMEYVFDIRSEDY